MYFCFSLYNSAKRQLKPHNLFVYPEINNKNKLYVYTSLILVGTLKICSLKLPYSCFEPNCGTILCVLSTTCFQINNASEAYFSKLSADGFF